jgi:two-component sensor histidine kinase
MQAMVKMSAKSASDVSQLEASLAGRLAVLARTHDLFVSESSDRIPILQIILAEMAATQVPPERFKVQGRTELALQAKTAESATLILHELITNARRHGALSNDTGRITLRIEPQGEKEARIVWTESNGPKVAFPKHEGFGLNIMQTALGVDGDVKMEYRLDGIQCTIDLRSSRPRPVMEMARTTVVPQEKPDLTGKRILILEDEALIALSLEMTLTDEGAEVVGPFSSSSQALTALDEDIDAAILDVNLGRTTSLDVAHRLKERGVPFVFVTGDGDWHQVSEAFPDVPVLDKPIRELEVVMNLGRVL